jgi:hypothetical protein
LIVKDSVQRQLNAGWSHVKTFMTPAQKIQYINAIKANNISLARAIVGHALHQAVDADLARRYVMPDGKARFLYNSSYGPDFYDRVSGRRVELTTVKQFMPHLRRVVSGAYRNAGYVLYQGPGRLP